MTGKLIDGATVLAAFFVIVFIVALVIILLEDWLRKDK
jgi:hypothetical protein